MASNKEYFAARPAEELCRTLGDKMGERRSVLVSSGMRRKCKKSYQLYYGNHYKRNNVSQDSEILRFGDRGEIAALAVNHYRNLIKNTLVLTTNQKPAFNCRANNADYDSIQQTRLGNSILDYSLMERRAIEYPKKAAEQAQVFGKGFIFDPWDPGLGKALSAAFARDDSGQVIKDQNTGEPIEKIQYEGDFDPRTPSLFSIHTDPSLDDWNRLEWFVVEVLSNKWNLAAQYPKAREQILNVELDQTFRSTMRDFSFQQMDEASNIIQYIFIHKSTKALPNGRIVTWCDNDVVMYDGPSPYIDRLPLFRIVPGEVFGTTEGYSDFFDLMGIQEATNILVSTIFTNQQAFGMQRLWAPEGANYTVQQLSKALALIKSPPGTKPEPLALLNTAKELFESVPMFQKLMETTSGINSITRGDPEVLGKNASGVAFAYVQAMAVQYTSAFQQSYANLLEDWASYRIWGIKKFMPNERKVAISGKRNSSYVSSYSAKDIDQIERVSVDIGNPITKTLAGRMMLADNYKELGFIKSPEDLFQVYETGQLDTATSDIQDQTSQVEQENEFLMERKPVTALVGDKHLYHAERHLALLQNPSVRNNAPIVKEVLAHVQDHVNKYRTQDPIFSQLAGEPAYVPPQPPVPPMPPHQGPPGPPPGAPGPGGPLPPPGSPGSLPPGKHLPHPRHPGESRGPGIAQMMMPPSEISHIPHLPSELQPPGTGLS